MTDLTRPRPRRRRERRVAGEPAATCERLRPGRAARAGHGDAAAADGGPGRRRPTQVVEGQAGGGVVQVEVTGGIEFRSVDDRPGGRRPRRRRDAPGPRARRAPRRRGPGRRGCSRPMGGFDLGADRAACSAAATSAALGDDLDDDERSTTTMTRIGADDELDRGRRRPVSIYAGPVQDLIDELGRLPGVGPKSAQRIAFHLLKLPKAGRHAPGPGRSPRPRSGSRSARRCFNIAEGDECGICADDRRDATVLCVVEEPRDIVAVERTGEFHGPLPRAAGRDQPHRGHRSRPAAGPGAARPPRRRGHRRRSSSAPTPTSRARPPRCTSAGCSSRSGITVTRIASGLPVGGDLEYADELTLGPRPRGPPRGRAGRRREPRSADRQCGRCSSASVPGSRVLSGCRSGGLGWSLTTAGGGAPARSAPGRVQGESDGRCLSRHSSRRLQAVTVPRSERCSYVQLTGALHAYVRHVWVRPSPTAPSRTRCGRPEAAPQVLSSAVAMAQPWSAAGWRRPGRRRRTGRPHRCRRPALQLVAAA